MKNILVFVLFSFFVFAFDVPHFSYCLNNYASILKPDEEELKDCVDEESNNAQKNEKLIEDNAKKNVKNEEKFLFRYWKLFGLFFILYVFMCKRTGNFFWPLFFFSCLFGYDRKYETPKRSGRWIPFDATDSMQEDSSLDDKE